jgi:hypothetical protein
VAHGLVRRRLRFLPDAQQHDPHDRRSSTPFGRRWRHAGARPHIRLVPGICACRGDVCARACAPHRRLPGIGMRFRKFRRGRQRSSIPGEAGQYTRVSACVPRSRAGAGYQSLIGCCRVWRRDSCSGRKTLRSTRQLSGRSRPRPVVHERHLCVRTPLEDGSSHARSARAAQRNRTTRLSFQSQSQVARVPSLGGHGTPPRA